VPTKKSAKNKNTKSQVGVAGDDLIVGADHQF